MGAATGGWAKESRKGAEPRHWNLILDRCYIGDGGLERSVHGCRDTGHRISLAGVFSRTFTHHGPNIELCPASPPAVLASLVSWASDTSVRCHHHLSLAVLIRVTAGDNKQRSRWGVEASLPDTTVEKYGIETATICPA